MFIKRTHGSAQKDAPQTYAKCVLYTCTGTSLMIVENLTQLTMCKNSPLWFLRAPLSRPGGPDFNQQIAREEPCGGGVRLGLKSEHARGPEYGRVHVQVLSRMVVTDQGDCTQS